MSEQSYIIRIYRFDVHRGKEGAPGECIALAGILESPVSGRQEAFHDIGELWAILVRNGMAELENGHPIKSRRPR